MVNENKKKVLNDDNKLIPPDNGWGFIVLIGAILSSVTVNFIKSSLLSFNNNSDDIDGENEYEYIDDIPNLLINLSFYCSAPISALLANRYGCTVLTIIGYIIAEICLLFSIFATNSLFFIITLGLGTGSGLGFIYFSAIYSVIIYFKKCRSLATGIVMSSSGFGYLLLPISQYLFENLKSNLTILIFSLLIFPCLVFSCCLRPLKNHIKRINEAGKASFLFIELLQLFINPLFFIFSFSYLLCNIFSSNNFSIIFKIIEANENYNLHELRNIPLIIECSQIIGGIGIGLICILRKINPIYVHATNIMICGIATIMAIYCENIYGLTTYTIILNLTIGGFYSLTPVVLAYIFGLKNFSNGFGILLLIHGIVQYYHIIIFDWVFDNLTNISGLVLCGCVVTICGIVLFPTPTLENAKRHYKRPINLKGGPLMEEN